ncbi:MAG: dTMP kinase [Chloroflexi bacterium]|nr:dTMP kinase [Chloroflexota bacterium]
MSGFFVTFEGPEGSGKTTQIRRLAAFLEAQGYQVVMTREPGGTLIGDQIRQILLAHGNEAMKTRTEVLLFQASRAQHVAELIQPALEQGKIVLCDRFADSTLAYQGFGRGESLEDLRRLIAYATNGLKPHLTLLLDVDVEEGLRRRQPLLQEWNRLDAEALAFHQKVREGYLQLAQAEPERWVVVDAEKPIEAVEAAIREIVQARLKANKP